MQSAASKTTYKVTGKRSDRCKLNLGILFGGRSAEHEVSVRSATSILKAVDRSKYNIHLIGIDKSGRWHLGQEVESLVVDGVVSAQNTPLSAPTDEVSLAIHHHGNLCPALAESEQSIPHLDLVFPVLHGTFGEDGTVQGVLEMSGLPYVGCGVAASALAMDKALAKKVLAYAGIPQAPHCVCCCADWRAQRAEIIAQIERQLAYPLFVKPANMGSSVGVGKAAERCSLTACIHHALEYDNKIVIEQSMENCHEIECAVLGNEQPEASVVGEIIPGGDFYSYETKYMDDKSQLVIPAPLDDKTSRRVRQLAIDAFKAIDGRGLARVDFFVHKQTLEITLNEINTLPGFTPISMYPRLWAATGVEYSALIDRLIALALENHTSKKHLKRAL